MSHSISEIRTEHLDDLALGSVFLATGGGGDPYVPKLITAEALKTFGPVDLLSPGDVDDDAFIVPIGSVGAPTVSLELLPSVEDAARTLDAFEKYIGRKVKPTPALAYDYAGNNATFETDTTETYERHIRAFSMAAGGMITAAEHTMTGRQLKDTVIPGTVSFSVVLGRLLREKRGQADTLLAPLQALFSSSIYGTCCLLYAGKVTDKTTRIIGGYDIGEATIEDFAQAEPPLSINIKNEYLLARQGDRIRASVPDLITIVDYETGTPINAERLRFGQRVAVFATGCPEFYRNQEALKVVEPRCFGFDIDYVPLESLGLDK